jgi:hypothetical protein
VKSRLHDKDKEIRSYTLFFKLNETLPADGLTREKTKPIPIGKITQLIKQPIPVRKKEKRRRQ